MKNNKISKYNKQLFAIAIALVLIIGGSYAWLTLSLNGVKTNILRAGTLALTLDDTTSEGIDLANTVPMSDIKGLTTTAYSFTLKNNGSTSSDYTIYLDDLGLDTSEVRMADKYVKYSLTKNSSEATTALLTTIGTNPNRILDEGTITANTTNTYTLRIWIDSNADNEVMGTVFSSQLRVDATQHTTAPKHFNISYYAGETNDNLPNFFNNACPHVSGMTTSTSFKIDSTDGILNNANLSSLGWKIGDTSISNVTVYTNADDEYDSLSDNEFVAQITFDCVSGMESAIGNISIVLPSGLYKATDGTPNKVTDLKTGYAM